LLNLSKINIELRIIGYNFAIETKIITICEKIVFLKIEEITRITKINKSVLALSNPNKTGCEQNNKKIKTNVPNFFGFNILLIVNMNKKFTISGK
tara:strand:+ start:231 stop:515 length:285 start_codon:yes stop_codon:yes gene_type:complete